MSTARSLTGIPMTPTALDAAVSMVVEASRKQGVDVHLCNAYTLALAAEDPRLHATLAGASLNFVDGKPVVWALRRLYPEQPADSTRGADLMRTVLSNGDPDLKHFFLGAAPEVLAMLLARVAADHPSAKVVGAISPPFRPLSEAEHAEQGASIRASGANIVWVGLGTPLQDFEARRLATELGVVAVAVGAAFDFIARSQREAPTALRGTGLEWLFRLSQEPRRLARRYAIYNYRFLRLMVREGVL